MMLWARCRRVTTTLPAGCVAAFALAVLVGGSAVQLPAISAGGSVAVKLSLFIPALVAAVLALSLDSRVPAAEISGIRKVRHMDVGLVLAVIVGLGLVGILTAHLLGAPPDHALWTLGRNTACTAGLLLLARPWLRRAAVMVPIAMVFGVILFGFRRPTDPYPWGFVLERPTSPFAAFACAVIAVAGMGLHVRAVKKEEL